MTNRNFEDIDRLFREGLNPDGIQFTSADADWSKLKDRLERNNRRKRSIFWLSRLSGVAALILLFFAIRMFLPENPQQIAQQAEVRQNAHKLKVMQGQPTVTIKVKNRISKPENVSNALLAQNKPIKKIIPQTKSTYTPDEKEIPENDTARVENLTIAETTTTQQMTDTTGQKLAQKDVSKSAEQKQSSADESLFAPNERPNLLPEPEHQYRKLALSVLAAPDYNGVNNMSNASIGNDFGLLVTLKISKKWSLSTGGVYAKKLYETGFSNYNPTKNLWDEYYPKSVNADCRVLDIPMNINYTLLTRKNTTISLGSGISSYIMLREDYSFTYDEPEEETTVAYHAVNENQHWLSVLNFQATIEQRLNSRVSIGLQPFMKIPLSNIGFAGVKLQTVGMAVILSWNIN